MDRTAQEHFKALVNSLGLAVGLWVVTRAELQVSAQLCKHFTLENTGEHGITVRDN